MTEAQLIAALNHPGWSRAFFLGLARTPAPDPAVPPLAVLALWAQRRRFERPATGPGEAVRWPDDDRPLLPQAARATLLRLAASRDDHLLGAALDRLNWAGLRLHPFDLPRLEARLRGLQDRLGGVEAAYLRAAAPTPGESIAVANWTEFTRAPRLAFLRELRRRDPAAARSLAEAAFAQEPADFRRELVLAMADGASEADRAFLERALADRGARIREAAAELLSRIPGTQQHAERLAAAVAALRPSRGIFGRGKVAFRNVRAADLEGLRLGELSKALGADLEALLEGLPRYDVDLACALARMALADGVEGVLPRLMDGLTASDGGALLGRLVAEGETPSEADRREAAARLVRRAPEDFASTPAWTALYGMLREPLAPALAEALFAARAWRELLGSFGCDGPFAPAAKVAALLCLAPYTQAQRLADDLAAIQAAELEAPKAFLALVLALGPCRSSP